MKIHFALTRAPYRYSRGSRDGYNGPLGLAAMATTVEALDGGHDVAVYDLELFDHPVEEVVDADVLAINVTGFTFEPAVALAREAQKTGAKVVLGGTHAATRAAGILREYPEIDAVCTGQGEAVMEDFANGLPMGEIRNLVWRCDGDIKRNGKTWVRLNERPAIDRKFLNYESYLKWFGKLRDRYFPGLPYSRPLATFSQVGCAWRDNTGGCNFCSRALIRSDFHKAETYWQEIENLHHQFGADLIWDFSDSFPSDPDWVETIVKTRPKNLDVGFYLYGRADELDGRMLDLMCELNVKQVLMGIETADPCLKEQKGTTVSQDLDAIQRMQERGIRVFPSYCLGLEGETSESLKKTVALARRVADLCEPWEVACSLLIPFAGTMAYRQLVKQSKEARVALNKAHVPPEQLQRWWANAYSHASWEELLEAQHQILRTAPLKSSFGVPVMDDRRPYCDEPTWEQFDYWTRRETTMAEA